MPASLILNADDFGLTAGINRAVGELWSAGVLTSATLMANGPAFADAVRVAQGHRGLGVGCHIVLTDGVPVSRPQSVPSLLGSDRRSFRPSLIEFLQALVLGRIRRQDVVHEAMAQVEKLQRAGIKVTHLDTHKHLHLFPGITGPLLEVAERTSVDAVRNPFEPAWSLALEHGSTMRRLGVRLMGGLRGRFDAHAPIKRGRIKTTDGTVAISATGELDATSLAAVLRAIPADGTYELCCHPGYNDRDLDGVATRLRAHRDVERAALLREVPEMLRRAQAPELIDYGGLKPGARAAGRSHLDG